MVLNQRILKLSVFAMIAFATSSVAGAFQNVDDDLTDQQKLTAMVEKITGAVITNPDNLEGHINKYDNGDEVYEFTLKSNVFDISETLCQRNRTVYTTTASNGIPTRTRSLSFYQFMKKDIDVACLDVDRMVDFGRHILNHEFLTSVFDNVQELLIRERVENSSYKDLLGKISFKDLTDIRLDWDELGANGRKIFTATFTNPEKPAHLITVNFEVVNGLAVISEVRESTVNI